MRQIYKVVFITAIISVWILLGPGVALAEGKLEASLSRIEQHLQEESIISPLEPNSLTYLRAFGERSARTVSPRDIKNAKVLTLEQYLQSAFINSNEIKQAHEQF